MREAWPSRLPEIYLLASHQAPGYRAGRPARYEGPKVPRIAWPRSGITKTVFLSSRRQPSRRPVRDQPAEPGGDEVAAPGVEDFSVRACASESTYSRPNRWHPHSQLPISDQTQTKPPTPTRRQSQRAPDAAIQIADPREVAVRDLAHAQCLIGATEQPFGRGMEGSAVDQAGAISAGRAAIKLRGATHAGGNTQPHRHRGVPRPSLDSSRIGSRALGNRMPDQPLAALA